MQNNRLSLQRLLAAALALLMLIGMSARADDKDYRLGAGDLLKIGVFDHPELASDVRVSQTGNISFPLIGQLSVSGLSTHDVEAQLTRRLEEGGYVHRAQVSVLVMEYQSQKVSVMGMVAKPGQYPLQTANKVLDLLAQAGGLITAPTGAATGLAGDQATLLRHDGSKVTIDLQALFDGDPRQNPVVVAGDTIYVPRAPQFYIYGEVQRPGVYRLERNMTVSQAISTGGGLTPRGSEHRLMIKRRDSDGKERKISVHGSDLLLQDDVLLVKESLF